MRPAIRFALVVIGIPLAFRAQAQPAAPAPPPGPADALSETLRIDAALRDEILAMSEDDQRVRKNAGMAFSKEEIEAMRRVDEAHERRMRQIIGQHGWPGKALVGADCSNRAWLIVQHCSPSFQQECLPLLERAVAVGEASPKNYAYLLDRVRMGRGQPQIYGTQFLNGELWKIEDPEHVDDRRRAVGLGPLAEYVDLMRKVFPKPALPPAPAAPGAPESRPPPASGPSTSAPSR